MPVPCSPRSLLRWAQSLCCSVSVGAAASSGPWLRVGGEASGCVAAWAVPLGLTLLLLLHEAAGRPPPRRDLPLTLAAAAAVSCAAATVVWPLGQLRDTRGLPERHVALRVVATVASALAAAGYAAEVARDRAKPGETAPYLATPSGLLKVGETLVALVLLGLAAEQGAAAGREGWRWCLAIYCVSFALGVLLIGGFLGGWGWCGCGGDPVGLRRALGLHAALGFAAYAAATVLWALWAFRGDMGGQEQRPGGCGAACPWDRWVLVAAATALNLVAFGADLVQTGRLVLLRG
ncbi:myeloid-associated differentiation marker homolog [Caloenas nicobarica]|uniref:myeloid-associated differentiation marker homolog n=1 Tax=Caloenas nicobarica TaxID=187106 RepID=UPI0032B73827